MSTVVKIGILLLQEITAEQIAQEHVLYNQQNIITVRFDHFDGYDPTLELPTASLV